MTRAMSQAGDTIVEVLIAIAVTSAILSSSFVVVNHSLKNARQSQEHGEALKLLEGQLEQVKSLSTDTAQAYRLFDATHKVFCLNPTTAPTYFSGAIASVDRNTDYSSYPAACVVGVIPNGYHLAVIRTGNPDGSFTFTASAVWDSAVNGRDQESLVYKVFK